MHRMMRSLKASARSKERLAGRGSPQVASQPVQSLVVFPFGSTDGTGVKLPSGSISGIEAQTQAQQISDYTGTLQYLAPKCYGIRGSFVVTNELLNSNVFSSAGPEAIIASTSILDPRDGNTASFLQETTATGPNWPRFDLGVGSVPQGQINTVSVDAAPAGRQWFFLLFSDTQVGGATIWFDMVNEVWGSESNINNTLVDKKFEVLPNGYFRISLRYRCAVNTPSGILSCGPTIANGSTPVYTGDGSSGVYLFNMQHFRNTDIGIPNEVGPTTTTPVTVCFDHLPDGTPLRPFYTLGGGIRYNVFRPTELARSRVFNVGECIEAVASDGIRRYYRMAGTLGTQKLADPSFDASGWSVGANATIGGGQASIGDGGYIQQLNIGTVAGQSYFLFTDVASAAGAGIYVPLNGGGESPPYTAPGVYGCKITANEGGQPIIYVYSYGIPGSGVVNSVNLYEIGAATSATTGASSPTFPPSGLVVDGGVVWEMAGYASIMGIEFAPTGNANHPEGVLLHFPAANNVLGNDQIVAMDVFLDTAGIWSIYGQTSVAFQFNTNLIYWFVGAQTRASTADKTSGVFLRLLGRMSTANAILYIDGAMFTGASGGNLPPTGNVFFGTDVAGTMPRMTILNFRVLTNSALNDANAIARSRYDLKPYVALNADNNAELANV